MEEVEKNTGPRNFSIKDHFNEEFSWYQMLYYAANENYINIEKVLETEAQSFLTFCNFLVRKNEVERVVLEQQMKH